MCAHLVHATSRFNQIHLLVKNQLNIDLNVGSLLMLNFREIPSNASPSSATIFLVNPSRPFMVETGLSTVGDHLFNCGRKMTNV